MNEIFEANKKGKNVLLTTNEGFAYRGRLYPCELVEEREKTLQLYTSTKVDYEGERLLIVCAGLFCEEKRGVRYYLRKIKEEDIERVGLVYGFE